MMIVIIFLSISVPYRIAFEDIAPPAWVYTDTVLNFFSAIENDNGDIIIDRKKIALRYL